MEPKSLFLYPLNLVTADIGVYMVARFWNAALPPVLSGAAFIAMAVAEVLED